MNNTIYVGGGGGHCVLAIDGATNQKIARIPTGSNGIALCYNPQNNRVYCANEGSDSVTVIDGALNSVITTVAAGDWPYALCYDPQTNKVYCANRFGDNVTVIDGATNQVLRTIGVGDYPGAFCDNPRQNRVYVANYYGSSISVLRDSGGGVEEGPSGEGRVASGATTVRGVLNLPSTYDCRFPIALRDISGRNVLTLKKGENDVRFLPAGVYFLRPAVGNRQSKMTRVVIAR